MGWIRKNPFVDEDPLEVMIECLAQEARSQGEDLTEQERALLRAEDSIVDPENDTEMDPLAELRYLTLIRAVLEKEAALEYENKLFSKAIEWAGDQQYPYVVALAEQYITENQPRRRIADQFYLLATGLAIVFVMFAIVAIIGILSEKH